MKEDCIWLKKRKCSKHKLTGTIEEDLSDDLDYPCEKCKDYCNSMIEYTKSIRSKEKKVELVIGVE